MRSLLQDVSVQPLVLVFLVLLVMMPFALAETETSPPITVTFNNALVADIIRHIVVQIEGAELVTDDISGTLSVLYLVDKQPEEALDLICKQQGLNWWKEGKVYFVSSHPRQATEAPTEQPAKAAAGPATRVEYIELKYANPSDISWLFGGCREPATPGFADATLGTRKAVTPSPTGLVMSQREVRSPFDEMNQLAFPGTTVLPTPIPGAIAPAPTMPTGPTTPTAAREITGPLAQLLPEGLSRPVAIPFLNAVIVQGPEEAIRQFRLLVALLDVKVKQVMIEANFVNVSTREIYKFGLDWSAVSPNLEVTVSGLNTGGSLVVNYARGNVQAVMQAVIETGRGKVVSAPKVTTMNNLPASLFVTTSYPYFTQTSVVQPGLTGGQVIAGSSLSTVALTSGLTVTPKINEDRSITATMVPQISVVLDTITGPGGSTIPIVESRNITTTLTVQDGETIVMGGFVQDTINRSSTRIPLLSDIPLLGRLFRSRNDTVSESELLIFMTAHIVPDSTPGILTAGEPVP